MWPDDPNPVGKTFYDGLGEPTTVIGIIEHMHGAWVGWDKLDHVMLFPRIRKGPSATYLVRTEPGRRDAVMREIEAKLGDSNPGRLLRWVRPFDYFIDQSYLSDRNMAIFLVSVTSALLAITALGIFGLATFNAWAVMGYEKVLWRDAPPAALWPELAVLGGMTIAGLALARVLARRWESA